MCLETNPIPIQRAQTNVRTRTQGPHGDGDRAVSERPLGRDGSQRTAAGAGALGAADRGVAEAPSEEVATNPTTELPEPTRTGK